MNGFLRVLALSACIVSGVGGANTPADQTLPDNLDADIKLLQNGSAHSQYQAGGKKERVDILNRLQHQAAEVVARHPGRAEPLIWSSIILATKAGEDGGMAALSLVKSARSQLQAALELDEMALDGSAHVTLGSLYYQVPVWPLAFGSSKKAERHLRRALEINPGGIDANYFYGGYLEKSGNLQAAIAAFEKALSAPPRADRKVADDGRKLEAKTALSRLKRKLAVKSGHAKLAGNR